MATKTKRATKKPAAKKKTAAARKRKSNPIPLGKFIRGEIRIVKKAGKKLLQFRKAK